MSEHTPLSVPKTVQLDAALNDPRFVASIGSAYPDIREVMTDIQRAITTPDNIDKIGPTILAMRHIDDIFLLFKAAYDLKQSQEKQKQ
jgi:hypothetical protein